MNEARPVAGAAAPDSTREGAAAEGGVSPWGTVVIFMILYALAYFDKRIITLLIEPIRKSIGASDVEMSILSGAAFVSFYVLFSFPIGWASDRLSRRNVAFYGVVCWSIFAGLGAFARNFWYLLGSRFGVGAGEASLMPTSHSIIADKFPNDRLARALGVFTLGAFIGSALSFAVGGTLLAHFSKQGTIDIPLVGALLPWQAVFLFTSLPGIPLAMLLFLIKEPPRSGSAGRKSVRTTEGAKHYFAQHWRFYALHFFGFSILSIMTAGFSSWLPTHILRTFQEPIGTIGLVLAALQMTVGPLGMLLVVRTVDNTFRKGRSDAHMKFYVWGALFLAVAGALVGFAPKAPIAYVGVMLFDSMHGGFLPVAGAVLQLATPPRYRGQATAMFFVAYNVIGQALGPIAVAVITDYALGNEALIGPAIGIVCLIVGPMSAFLLARSRPHLRAALAAMPTGPKS